MTRRAPALAALLGTLLLALPVAGPAGAAPAGTSRTTTATTTTASTAAASTAAASATTAAAVPVDDLVAGQRVVDGTAQLVMQGDGNLVLYRDGRPAWHTSTAGHPGARLDRQGDGNLVVYAADGRALWSSGTHGLGAVALVLEGGSLVLAHPSGRPVWRDGTYLGDRLLPGASLAAGDRLVSPGRAWSLVLQPDGNLVTYRSGGGAAWSSRTDGSGADRLLLQEDGNLVLSGAGRPLWHTGTPGTATARLVLQEDGNAVLYGGTRALWDSAGHTGRAAVRVLPPFASSVAPVTEADLGASYRPGCPVGPSSLRQLTVSHVTLDGTVAQGRVVVHADLAARTVEVFRRLYEQRFPLQQMVPSSAFGGSDDAVMAAGSTSGFNCRRTTSGTAWSEHAYGRALDVNPVQNPYVSGATVLPEAGRAYLDRTRVRPGMVTPAVVAAFADGGFSWGGAWSSAKDYQHFSTTGR
ncbi:M15 family metallopeptidase [Aquipuribacter hungaricus]|uniref:M15 family metallopeptidase n=1 Tax=Aquipuribacter hungaricus TaxID=545624 RepID=A0ABV7WJY1_9MICO